MGGAKKKSPAQAEKAQNAEAAKKDGGSKKDKKEQKSKNVISVIVDEGPAMNFIKNSKVFTAQELSRQTSVKVSAANAFLLNLIKQGSVKRIGGYSGHHIYVPA
ncbi:MAG: MarR family transcriptional regulator [Thaumarchaeota archaeon]|nr:MarR family transcriptional regulator [Nitrososphaerota archaeon]